MQEKKDQREKRKPSPLLEKKIADILVTHRREEPFLIVFRYTGDNVASRRLGTLLGFFEIEVHDEDAAYIVNFLASVAKKEFFTNVRRDPAESFEATLHKINVALSELVKHGNVSWLGHLHGALAALIDNTVHFSVTGNGSIYLFRDGALQCISEGLSLEEDEPHPLKTFAEIAGGELFAGDRLFLFSPSVWTLFTPEDIERSVLRFEGVALEQFLRTALINELESAGVILIACEKGVFPPSLASVPTKEISSALTNVFSQDTFRPEEKPLPPPSPSSSEKKESEFIDTKTGHIYVQGEAPLPGGEHPGRKEWALLRERFVFFFHTFLQKTTRQNRRLKKNTVLIATFTWNHLKKTFRFLGRKRRSLRRRIKTLWEERRRSEEKSTAAPLFPETGPSPSIPTERRVSATVPVSPSRTAPKLKHWIENHTDSKKDDPSRSFSPPSSSVSRFPNSLLTAWQGIKEWTEHGKVFVLDLAARLSSRWKNLPRQTRWFVAVGVAVCLFFIALWLKPSSQEMAPAAPPAETSPTAALLIPPGEKNSMEISAGETLSVRLDAPAIGLFLLQGTTYAVTEKNIVSLSTGEAVSTLEPIRLAVAMDDLGILFLLSTDGTLFAYTPTNKRFIENTFPLPAGASADALGAYLTYLYVADGTNDQLYRFPRAEGGFGTPIAWFRESVSLAPSTKLAVGSIVALGEDRGIRTFVRGRSAGNTFEDPATNIYVSSLVIASDNNDVYALDGKAGRLLHWSESGVLERQYFSEILKGSARFTVTPDQKTLFVEKEGSVIRFALP